MSKVMTTTLGSLSFPTTLILSKRALLIAFTYLSTLICQHSFETLLLCHRSAWLAVYIPLFMFPILLYYSLVASIRFRTPPTRHYHVSGEAYCM